MVGEDFLQGAGGALQVGVPGLRTVRVGPVRVVLGWSAERGLGGFAVADKQELRGDGHAVVPSRTVGALRRSMAWIHWGRDEPALIGAPRIPAMGVPRATCGGIRCGVGIAR